MLQYPQIDPVALSLGPLKVHWYGLMYLIGFVLAWYLGMRRARRPGSGWTPQQVGDLIFYGALGVILGGRIGYMLFYGGHKLAADPLYLFRLWEGGMSFHGGAIGVLLALALFARKTGKRYFEVTDFGVPLVPLGLLAGRIGNFINGELWGRATDVPWGMVFPADAAQLVRHPSQLYQATLEGLLLFLLLWFYSRRPRPLASVTGLFGVGYGMARIIGEFFRQPDAYPGFIAGGWLTMGMLLSLPMVLLGIAMMVWGYRNHPQGARA
ncbi:prolipoprotein diacylglyceryl transferase [Isoalcanivorax beigongshangi]|uniref:Phosphatidylglycerol--prolipoprotein diacylglyceryl transferase n=1 Tax=Isoalcanivorax beigongshangi TaxID=3238810 RepID=A0ABV4AM87_9GAMM